MPEPSQNQQPRKFVMPGDVYVRPGIDDKPDPDKVLSAADKAAIARLAVRLPQDKATASADQSGLQSTRMATEVTPAVAAATIDAAMPDPDSAYLDMRDPVVAADGTRPTKAQMLRIKLGFVAGAILCAVPMAAATGTLLPAWLDRFGMMPAVSALCLLSALGAVISFYTQTVFASTSDATHSVLGRRTMWIVGGGLLTGLAMWGLASLGGATILPRLVVILWCVVQACYGMLIGPFVSVMADRVPDKFRPSADAWYGTALAAAQMLGGFAGVLFVDRIHQGFTWGAAALALAGIVAVAVWPRERSSVEMRLPSSMDDAFASLSLKGKVPGFRRVFWSRLFLMTAVGCVTVVAFFVAKYGVFAGTSGVAGERRNAAAAVLLAWMGVATLVASLVAAWASGPIADRFGAWGPSLAGAACVAVGALLPIVLPGSALGLLLFAGFAGFGLGLFNAVGQELVSAVLPDPREAGRVLGTLNLAGTLSVVVSALAAGVILRFAGSFTALFAAAVAFAVVSAAFLVSVKGAIDA